MSADIDLDFADRNKMLELIQHIPASMWRDGELQKHISGVYATRVPVDPATGICSIDHRTAEQLGYFKLDFLNVSVYSLVQSPEHLDQLLAQEPPWHRLQQREFFEQIVHVNNHWKLMQRMPEPIDSIPRMMMFLAVIRPGKRHLAGKPWATVAQTVWDRDNSKEGYSFRKSHAAAYAHLVGIHMNLIDSNGLANQSYATSFGLPSSEV